MSDSTLPAVGASTSALAGLRVAFVGKLASMPRREASALARRHGATVAEKPDASVQLIIVGEAELPVPQADGLEQWFDPPTREAADRGTLEIVTETELWQRLGLVERADDIHRLYTPAMLAELLRVPIGVVRRWHRRGLIRPAREVRRLPYFDFQEIATARRLAELLAAGVSPAAIEAKLAALADYLPGVERPLAQLSVIVQGRDILLRQGDGLIEPGGQRRFDFDAVEESAESSAVLRPLEPSPEPSAGTSGIVDLGRFRQRRDEVEPASVEELLEAAAELDDDGQLTAAVDTYRAAMAAGGPRADACFLLAELLYRLGDLAGARERYYTAVELDEDFVEARANLGCVLAETGRHDLAIAAFEGALRFHDEYADVHYHLARTLDDLDRRPEAEEHWRRFLDLAPDNPWADQARARLRG